MSSSFCEICRGYLAPRLGFVVGNKSIQLELIKTATSHAFAMQAMVYHSLGGTYMNLRSLVLVKLHRNPSTFSTDNINFLQ